MTRKYPLPIRHVVNNPQYPQMASFFWLNINFPLSILIIILQIQQVDFQKKKIHDIRCAGIGWDYIQTVQKRNDGIAKQKRDEAG